MPASTICDNLLTEKQLEGRRRRRREGTLLNARSF